MFKVFIADDEQYIVESLVSGIPWAEYGFTVCSTAGDGKSAFEEIAKLLPDLVITDIKMPCMSGLELVAKVKAKLPDTRFVIISGYAEFEYAKTAISQGVDGYLLKPIEEDEVISLLQGFRKELNKRLKEKTSSLLMEAIENDDNQAMAHYFSGLSVQCILSNGGRIAELEKRNEIIYCKVAKNQWLYLSKERFSAERLELMAGEDVLGIGVTLYNTAKDTISSRIGEAILRSYCYFMNAKMRICADAYDGQDIQRYHYLLEFLSKQLQAKDSVGAGQTIESLSLLLENVSMAELMKSFNMLQMLGGVEESEDEYALLNGILFISGKWKNARAYFEYFQKGMLNMLYPSTSFTSIYTDNQLISEILIYLQQHYMKNPSLSDLGEQYHINPAYLSKLFKKETNLSFLEYLTQIKMDKACAFLNKTNLSVNDVAKETGYVDYLYFRKVFKKCIGVTPSEYRNEKQAELVT